MSGIVRLDARDPLPGDWRGGVIALGNFDGFHLGHQAVVGRATQVARKEGRKAIIAAFDPHPMRYFRPETPPFRLTSLDQRERQFGEAGADAMLVFTFDGDFAKVTAREFVEDILLNRLGIAHVVTGEDFTFGNGRSGNIEVLRQIAGNSKIETSAVPAVMREGSPVSSTRIRELLKAGRPEDATALLTRPFAVSGTVQHGDKLGRDIGFPTANLDMGRYLRPAYGIYAVTGHLPDGRTLHGAANLGIRPSFDPPKELLEPYFFDFAEDLYGQRIEVALHHYIRAEARFDGLEPLKAQMDKDCQVAREWLAKNAPLA